MGSKINFSVLLVLLLATSSFIALTSAEQTSIGTKQEDDCIDLLQSCANCTYVNFTSYTMPNGTRTVFEVEGVKEGTSYTYNSCNLTSQLGEWIIDGHGDVDGVDTVFAYSYDVTSSGNPTPDGMPIFQIGVIILVFGISCFMLYLSSAMNEVAFKIFFMVLSLIFLMATMISAYMIGAEGNITSAVNSTTLSLIYVIGAILFIVFIYIMIRQTINALEMLKIKKGLGWENGSGPSVAGYNTRKAY